MENYAAIFECTPNEKLVDFNEVGSRYSDIFKAGEKGKSSIGFLTHFFTVELP